MAGHKHIETERHTFGEDHGITAGQLAIIARIADNSVTSYKQRQEASKKFYKTLKDDTEKKVEPTESITTESTTEEW